MGKISGGNSWLNLVKKAFRSPSKDNNNQLKRSCKRREEPEQEQQEEKKRGKRRWIFRKTIPHETTTIVSALNGSTNSFSSEGHPKSEKHHSAAAEIIGLTRPVSVSVPVEYHSAVLIQTAFRGYLARRALWALKGIVKLQALVRGHNVRKQAKTTLQCIQAMMRVQDRVCNQRKSLAYRRSLISMSTGTDSSRESVASDNKFTSTYEHTSDDCDKNQYKLKEIQGLLQETKKEVTLKREILLAHAFSQQMWRSSGKDQEINRSWCDCYDEGDPVKIVEIDKIQSSKAHNSQDQHRRISSSTLHRLNQKLSIRSSPFRTKRLQMNSVSPRCLGKEHKYSAAQSPPAHYTDYPRRVVRCENSVPSSNQPKYMAATASANARLRSLSAPRQRPLTPERETKGVEKKRLSFTEFDPYNDRGGACSSISSLHSTLRNSSNCVPHEQKIFSPSSTGERKWLS